MALAPPKSGLFVGLPRAYTSETVDTTPVPVFSAAVLSLAVSVATVTQYRLIQNSSAALSLSLQLSGIPTDTTDAPDPGVGNALLVDADGNYLTDIDGNYLYGTL